MSCPAEESDIADSAIMLMLAPKDILLDVGHTLHDESDGKQNNTCDVSFSAEFGLHGCQCQVNLEYSFPPTYLSILHDVGRI
jgi:hypothetical protein